MKNHHFISRNWHTKKSTVAYGPSPIKINDCDYQKRFITRINESYDFSIKYRYLAIFH